MKKSLVLIILILSFFFIFLENSFSEPRKRRGDSFLDPQIGMWFGPISPVYDTYGTVNTGLGGGAFFRYNTPFELFKLGFDVSYQPYEADNINKITLVPSYLNLLFRLPIKTPINFQFKVGAGVSYIKIEPEGLSQRDPMGMAGFEVSFPVGKHFNVGMRLDYLLIYEGYVEGANNNGHFFNAGITLYFNL